MRFTIQMAAALPMLALLTGVLSGQPSEPSSKYYALRAIGGEKGIVQPQRIAFALHARAFQDDMAKRYRIVLLERPDNIPPEIFRAHIKKFENSHPSMKNVEVYSSSKGLSIPTGQIIIAFKDGTSAAEAKDILAKANLKVVSEPTKLLPQQFVVEALDDADAAEVAKKLALDPQVNFTEPDLLLISAPSK
jgi:hypothetical protein